MLPSCSLDWLLTASSTLDRKSCVRLSPAPTSKSSSSFGQVVERAVKDRATDGELLSNGSSNSASLVEGEWKVTPLRNDMFAKDSTRKSVHTPGLAGRRRGCEKDETAAAVAMAERRNDTVSIYLRRCPQQECYFWGRCRDGKDHDESHSAAQIYRSVKNTQRSQWTPRVAASYALFLQ